MNYPPATCLKSTKDYMACQKEQEEEGEDGIKVVNCNFYLSGMPCKSFLVSISESLSQIMAGG